MFLDSELKLIAFVYTKGFEDKEADEGLKRHILDLSTISARIKALDDCDELSKKFVEFTKKRLGIGNRVLRDRRDMDGAYQELQEAEKLAGEIIRLIKIRIRQQDK